MLDPTDKPRAACHRAGARCLGVPGLSIMHGADARNVKFHVRTSGVLRFSRIDSRVRVGSNRVACRQLESLLETCGIYLELAASRIKSDLCGGMMQRSASSRTPCVLSNTRKGSDADWLSGETFSCTFPIKEKSSADRGTPATTDPLNCAWVSENQAASSSRPFV